MDRIIVRVRILVWNIFRMTLMNMVNFMTKVRISNDLSLSHNVVIIRIRIKIVFIS